MRWRVVLIGLTGLMTFVTGAGRFAEGKGEFLVWYPLLTAVFSFLAVALMWREAFGPRSRDRA